MGGKWNTSREFALHMQKFYTWLNPTYKCTCLYIFFSSLHRGQISSLSLGIEIPYPRSEFANTKQKWYVFRYQNCSYLLWEKIVLVIEKNFWISLFEAEGWEFAKILRLLKHGFYKKSLRKDAPLTSWTQWKFKTICGNRKLFKLLFWV